MIAFDRWFLPDGEQHLQTWMTHANRRVDGRLSYQYHKYEAALKHCRQRRVAVDVGAHAGLWSFWMARDFAAVHAFEPKPEHILCWSANMADATNARVYPFAIGQQAGRVDVVTEPTSSGDSRVERVADDAAVEMRTLDSFHLEAVDFLKIDCEGYEAFVIEGASETLQRCRPTVIVEQKPGHGQRFGRGELDAVTLLKAMGAKQVWDYAGDYVLAFPSES